MTAATQESQLDPRSPLVRLAKFFDNGEFVTITPIDDSGVLSAVGTARGVHCVAFCTDPTVQGGAMGSVAAEPSSPLMIALWPTQLPLLAFGIPAAPAYAKALLALTASVALFFR